MILTALVNSVSDTDVFKIQPPEVFLKFKLKFHEIHGKTSNQGLFFNKVVGLRPATLLKKQTPTQVFSCELC